MESCDRNLVAPKSLCRSISRKKLAVTFSGKIRMREIFWHVVITVIFNLIVYKRLKLPALFFIFCLGASCKIALRILISSRRILSSNIFHLLFPNTLQAEYPYKMGDSACNFCILSPGATGPADEYSGGMPPPERKVS